MLLAHLVVPQLFGIPWMDPEWLLENFHTEFLWLSLAIVFVECGLFFPFLPGDTLLFAVGLFISGDKLQINLALALALFCVAAFLGNIVGYEIGRRIGERLYERDGRIVKRRYIDKTNLFFDKHGSMALVLGRFVPFVRTYITLIAGVTMMGRRKFYLWSAIGAVLWVLLITLLGYFLGSAFPTLGENIDKAIIVILAFSVIPLVFEWWRHRRGAGVS